MDGAEVEIQLAPTRELRITANATYLNARFGTFLGNSFVVPRTSANTAPGANPCVLSSAPRIGGNTSCVGPASGNTAPLAPKLAMSLGFTYTVDVGAEGQLIANGLWSHTSNQFFEADERLDTGTVDVFNGSLEYRPSPTWGVEVFMNNIGDKRYYATSTGGGGGDQGAFAAPRTYGVNLKFDF